MPNAVVAAELTAKSGHVGKQHILGLITHNRKAGKKSEKRKDIRRYGSKLTCGTQS